MTRIVLTLFLTVIMAVLSYFLCIQESKFWFLVLISVICLLASASIINTSLVDIDDEESGINNDDIYNEDFSNLSPDEKLVKANDLLKEAQALDSKIIKNAEDLGRKLKDIHV